MPFYITYVLKAARSQQDTIHNYKEKEVIIMSTISMPTINLTVATATHAPNTSAIIRTVNPTNPEEILISYNGYIMAVNKRAWNMLSINAPVERIISMSDKED